MNESLAKIDVKDLTSVVMLLSSKKLNLNNQIDNELFNHIAYVTSRILLLLKNEGVSEETKEEICKYLWRLYSVLQSYNNKTESASLSRMIEIVTEFRKTFVGF